MKKVSVLPVYPCVYREHVIRKSPRVAMPGLSLCIQGTHFVLCIDMICRIFIPVYTGNTLGVTTDEIGYRLYPCVYREHTCKKLELEQKQTLSLCIQGTHSNYNILFYN